MSTGTLNRRQFVVLGGATVFTMIAGVPLFGTQLPPSFVSVGYHPGRTRLRIGGRTSGSPMSFVDAGSILAGDPRFFHVGGRVRLHSFTRAEGNHRAERIDVEALFRPPELEDPVPYLAFSSIAEPQRQMTSQSVAFDIPVDTTQPFELAIERRAPGDGGVERAVIPFAVNDVGTPAIKLNEGLYALAIVPAGQTMPEWTSIRTGSIVSWDDKSPVALVSHEFGSPSVPFDYILMSVRRRRGPGTAEAEMDAAETHELEHE